MGKFRVSRHDAPERLAAETGGSRAHCHVAAFRFTQRTAATVAAMLGLQSSTAVVGRFGVRTPSSARLTAEAAWQCDRADAKPATVLSSRANCAPLKAA